MRMFVEGHVVTSWVLQLKSPYVVNLPADFRIVDCQLDAARGGIVFTIRSSTFPRVARGTSIPEKRLTFNGLMFCRTNANRVGLVK